MARPSKPLEEQLRLAEEELERIIKRKSEVEQKIIDIKAAIEDRNMHDAYDLLKSHGMTVEELEAILTNKKS